ncbi:MAG: Ppx/GppA family phosphatase [Thermoplasmata archaeon]|nr:Ppx/GppA family phosphatase [Thermoplasmata archaeon]
MDRSRALTLARPAEEKISVGERPVAVLDVGSNTARLVLYLASAEGSLKASLERKEAPRLGHDVDAEGNLHPEAAARGLAALKRFAVTLRSLGNPRTLAVATSAVRDAPNGPDFVARAARETGITLRVISGVDEARYAYLGVASTRALDDDIVFDLGGGSLQLAEVRKGHLQNSVSLPLGVLRLTERFLEHDPPKGREIEALEEHVRAQIGAALEAFGRKSYGLNGVGGTVRSLARVAVDLRDYPIPRVHGYPFRDHDLEALSELLMDLPVAKRKLVPGIGGDRADVVVAGLVVLKELLRSAGAEQITVSGAGIREGIALEAVGAKLPAPAQELAHRSFASAAELLSFGVAEGEAIERVSGSLFELFREREKWGDEERLALKVASWMHGSGASVDLWRHARHSSYLIRNLPIWGLEHRGTLLASMTAYVHEGDEPRSAWRKEFLPIVRPSDLEVAKRLGVLLFSAETLYRAEPRFSLGGDGQVLSVSFGASVEASLSPRSLEKVRKPLERELGVEVKLRDS